MTLFGQPLDDQMIFAAVSSLGMLAYLLVVLNRHRAARRMERRAEPAEQRRPEPPQREPTGPWG